LLGFEKSVYKLFNRHKTNAPEKKSSGAFVF